MSKKDLEKFKPDKLRPGRSWSTEVVGENGFHRCYYFYRDRDGELFTTITKNHNKGDAEKQAWVKLKRTKPEKLKQLDFMQPEKEKGAYDAKKNRRT